MACIRMLIRSIIYKIVILHGVGVKRGDAPRPVRRSSSELVPARRIHIKRAGDRKVRCIDEEKEDQLLEIHQTEPIVFYSGSDFDVN